MSLAVRRALYGKMAGDGTLTAMLATPPSGVSKSIYHENAPEGANHPMVIFFKVSGIPRYSFGRRVFEDELWTVKGIDRTGDADRVDGISTRLDALLTDGTISISGSGERYLRRESDMEYEEVEDGVRYKHAGARYRLVHEPT